MFVHCIQSNAMVYLQGKMEEIPMNVAVNPKKLADFYFSSSAENPFCAAKNQDNTLLFFINHGAMSNYI
jgi:hypothetical protein